MDLQARETTVADVDFTYGGNLGTFGNVGFSVSEPAGTWTIGIESSLDIPLAVPVCTTSLRVMVQPCLFPGLIETQSLEIQVNGVPIGRHVARTAEWVEVSFAVPAELPAPADRLHVTFLHPTPIAPATTGRSSDLRLLSFMFKSLTLTGSPSPHGSAEAATPLAAASEVQRGHDGWLFLTGGTNHVLRYFQDAGYFTDAHAQRWADVLASRHQRLSEQGVRYLHIAAPDKISVYPHYFGGPLPNLDRHPTRLLADRLRQMGQDGCLIDPLPAFQNHPHRDRLYLKTDTHWTYEAGQTVLELVTARLGQPRHPNLNARAVTFYSHVWDLGSKMEPRMAEQYFAVGTLSTVRRVHANQLATAFEENVRTGKPVTHGSIYVAFQNTDPRAIDQVLVIFGDSFMDFQDSNTTTIFAENFREVHFVWSPSIDYDFVSKVKANVVITELAERFMIMAPNDEYSVTL